MTYAHEGYLLIDNRNSPGVPEEIAIKDGLPPNALKGGSIYESATFTCNHCEKVESINPHRPNGVAYLCRGCAHLLCDACGKEKVRTGICRPFKARVQDFLEEADKHPEPERVSEAYHSILLGD